MSPWWATPPDPAPALEDVYDARTLAALQPRPTTVGLGYTQGYLDDFEPEAHDLPLDAILNENGVVWPV